jgi:hypothetical protein
MVNEIFKFKKFNAFLYKILFYFNNFKLNLSDIISQQFLSILIKFTISHISINFNTKQPIKSGLFLQRKLIDHIWCNGSFNMDKTINDRKLISSTPTRRLNCHHCNMCALFSAPQFLL